MDILSQLMNKGEKKDDRLIAVQKGEFVIPADVVLFLGEGNEEKGFALLENMVNQIRGKAENEAGQTPSKKTRPK